MKINYEYGSKDRLFEMFQKVNKIKLTEDNIKTNILDSAFNDLINNKLNIKQTINQINGDENLITIVCTDNKGNDIVFKFRLIGLEMGQDDVYTVDKAELIEFNFKSETYELNIPEGNLILNEFNGKYGNNIVNIVADYVDFEKNIVDTLDETIKELEQTSNVVDDYLNDDDIDDNDDFVDDEYTNDELNKKDDDMFELPQEYNLDDIELDDEDNEDNITIDNFEDYINNQDFDNKSDESNLTLLAYNNLIAKNKTSKNPNYSPTKFEIDKEIERIKSVNIKKEPNDKKVKGKFGNMMAKGKKRVYPSWADMFLPENIDKFNISLDKTLVNGFNELPLNQRYEIFNNAKKMLDDELGDKKYKISNIEYLDLLGRKVVDLYKNMLELMNEVEKSGVNDLPTSTIYNTFHNLSDESKKIVVDRAKKKLKIKYGDRIHFLPKDRYLNELSREIVIIVRNGLELMNENENDIEQIINNKKKVGEILIGGKGDYKQPTEFNREQIIKGLKVEKEHTNDPMVAIEIVMDHLTEDPEYYTRKETPEQSAQYGAAMDVDDDSDDELTKIILGYKPHNVGESVDVDVDTMYRTIDSVINSIRNKVEKNGYTVDERDLWKEFKNNVINVGDSKLSIIPLYKNNQVSKIKLMVLVKRLDSGIYELKTKFFI